ncbi:MAG: hypothetical protein ACOVLB_08210, partial [Candidatus Nanopelagicus sp.]
DEPYLLIISFLACGVNAIGIAPSVCHEGLGVTHEGALSRFSRQRLPAQYLILKIGSNLSVIY